MLDRETKRRIDSARDILVGKVPDPKSQVEQITIALIYKFMNDMDRETQEQGGSRLFFAGKFEKYRWAKLMSPGMGGSEMLNLYAEAIEKMNENPSIPQLFRDIFKNAYLPYRNPETLRLFLKVIDEFRYTDSERLGDAFEYLLSVLGSQGDAGQFRTPRHIIDFMVDIVAPKKHEVILDPACGTAGFLISSYNYIRNANAKGGKPGAALTPRERRRLAENISGYDIAPDMVRLALANMYLHGFREPRIYEYDTLTSEDRWNETADVILANPPFMTPKGGIRPHGRFSIQAKRSEVLFVDYIAEHLSAKGRAAVIVPEGIIFQSAGAYKNLRKMLVESYLVAVVSLPAGVFNPYSGVKTSILFMDKAQAKKSGDILFVKVENDGYDLGAQRRRIEQNDLPQAARAIKAHLTGNTVEQNFAGALTVAREKVNEATDWNLNGEMYREVEDIRRSDWPMVALGEVAKIRMGETLIKKDLTGSGKPIFSARESDEPWNYTEKTRLSFGKNTIVVGARGTVGSVTMPNLDEFTCTQTTLAISANEDVVETAFLFRILKQFDFSVIREGVGIPMISVKNISKIKIPVPPLDVQREILAEINAHQKLIDGARQVVENYTPRIPTDPAWPTVKLGDVCDSGKGDSITRKQCVDGDIPVIGAGKTLAYYHNRGNRTGEVVTVSGYGAYAGFVNFFDHPIFASSNCFTFQTKDENTSLKFVYLMVKSRQSDIYSVRRGSAQPYIHLRDVSNLQIPFPSLAEQKRLVAEIEEEEKLIDANRALIRAFEQKIKTKIAAVWGK